MGSTAPMSLAVHAQLPGAAWGWLWRPVSLLTIPLRSGPAGRREREKNAVERASIAADRGEDGGTFHPGHHSNIRASSVISRVQGEVRQAAVWRRLAVPRTERSGHVPCTMKMEMF